MTEYAQPNHEQEAFLDDITRKVRKHFPFLPQVDSDTYREYDPENDPNGTGQILWFYPEGGKTPNGASMGIIYRPRGFVIYYNNCPPPDDQPRIRNAGNSFYGPSERRYLPGEEDFALEKAQIHMEGIVKGDPKPFQQIVGWIEDPGKFITLEEKIQAYQTKKQKLSFKDKVIESYLSLENNIWRILEVAPSRAREIAIARLQTSPTYTTFAGETMPTEQIIDEITKGTKAGATAVERELHLIGAYETLMRDHQLL